MKMNRFIIILLISLIHSIGFGQSVDSAKTSTRALVFYFSPEYSYRNLKSNNAEDVLINYRDTVEKPKFGYTAGVNILLNASKNISIETGILFSDRGQKTKKISLGNSVSQTALPIYSTIINHFYYLGVPVKVNYYLISNNFKLFVSGGAQINVLMNQKTITLLEYSEKQPDKNSETTNDDYQKLNVALFAGIGLQQKLDNRSFFTVTPVYTHSIQSVTALPVKSYFYSIGINLALHILF